MEYTTREMEKVEIKFDPSCLKELVVGNKTFRSSCDFLIREADREKARRELNETDEVRKESLQKLKEMLSRDKDFRYRMDDAYLLRFLRYRKFNTKETYKYFHNLYKMRNEYPDVFHLPQSTEALVNTKVGVMLPYRDEEGHMLFILRFGRWNTSELHMRNMLQLFSLISDIATMNPNAQINGVINIFDFGGTGLSHASQILQPSLLRLWTTVLQDMHPWRVQRIVCFNCSAIQYAGFTIVKSFLKKKIADRVTLLRSDCSQLHEYINPVLLPKEYGGSLDDKECDNFVNKPVLGNLRYLEYDRTFIDAKKP